MGQLGMQMPGSQGSRGSSMNVYTGLLFVAFVALIGACGLVYMHGSKIGKDGKPWQIQAQGSVAHPDIPPAR